MCAALGAEVLGRGLQGPQIILEMTEESVIIPRLGRLDLGLNQSLVSTLTLVSKMVKYRGNSSFFPRNDQGMRKKSPPQFCLDLGLGQGNSLVLDLGLEKGALADLWVEVIIVVRVGDQDG